MVDLIAMDRDGALDLQKFRHEVHEWIKGSLRLLEHETLERRSDLADEVAARRQKSYPPWSTEDVPIPAEVRILENECDIPDAKNSRSKKIRQHAEGCRLALEAEWSDLCFRFEGDPNFFQDSEAIYSEQTEWDVTADHYHDALAALNLAKDTSKAQILTNPYKSTWITRISIHSCSLDFDFKLIPLKRQRKCVDVAAQVGDYSANIWLSCYTKSTEQDIKLSHYIAVEQSVLERCTAIIYKHKADFASSTELTVLGGGAQEAAQIVERNGAAQIRGAPNGAKDGTKVTARVVQEKHDIPSRERELHDTRNAVLQAGEEQLRKQKAEVEKKEKELKDKEQELKDKEHRLAALEAQDERDEHGEGSEGDKDKVKVVTEPEIAT
eukprot:s216_g21.t1